jgi:hypothetical protein
VKLIGIKPLRRYLMESRLSQLSFIILLFLIILPLSNACTSSADSITGPATVSTPVETLAGERIAAYENPNFDIMEFHEPHMDAQVYCLVCHTEHNGIVKPFPETCQVCHPNPIGSHEAHGPTGILGCLDCHKNMGGYIPNTDDCLVCHAPLESHPYLYDCTDCHND